jgi:hypothetical protein
MRVIHLIALDDGVWYAGDARKRGNCAYRKQNAKWAELCRR